MAQEKTLGLTLVSFLPDIPPGGNWAIFINQVDKISNKAIVKKYLGCNAIYENVKVLIAFYPPK